ncbi:hypothetical protein ACWGN5_14720 [Streptomyces sp. NPDC055815]
MTRTTPPRPVDVEAVFPALARHRRTTTRLHPRQGTAKPGDSSVAGPLLWPADEPWPVCTAVHPKGTGHLLSDVRLRRRLQDEARGRDFTDEERRLLDGMTRGTHAPELRDEDPLPLLAVAQLYAVHDIRQETPPRRTRAKLGGSWPRPEASGPAPAAAPAPTADRDPETLALATQDGLIPAPRPSHPELSKSRRT